MMSGLSQLTILIVVSAGAVAADGGCTGCSRARCISRRGRQANAHECTLERTARLLLSANPNQLLPVWPI
uniref:Putative secreted peptide n=1 Tax=Anopheles braziliensis TaxID=58242 RepID=A0A2M3ZWX2_9DIPT